LKRSSTIFLSLKKRWKPQYKVKKVLEPPGNLEKFKLRKMADWTKINWIRASRSLQFCTGHCCILSFKNYLESFRWNTEKSKNILKKARKSQIFIWKLIKEPQLQSSDFHRETYLGIKKLISERKTKFVEWFLSNWSMQI
jgi:hypothetical protein